MSQERSDEEIVKIALDNLYKYFQTGGLCSYFAILQTEGIITYPERKTLDCLLTSYARNKPMGNYGDEIDPRTFKAFRDEGLYWRSGDMSPRENFLEFLLERKQNLNQYLLKS